MATVQEIQNAVSCLSQEELSRFRNWFDEFDAVLWDNEIKEDAEAGRLNTLAKQAIEDFRMGNFKEL